MVFNDAGLHRVCCPLSFCEACRSFLDFHCEEMSSEYRTRGEKSLFLFDCLTISGDICRARSTAMSRTVEFAVVGEE